MVARAPAPARGLYSVARRDTHGQGRGNRHGRSPPAPGSAGPTAGGWTTPQPASDWVCVGGNWLPPGMTGGGGGSTGGGTGGGTTTCTTTQPASDWVCVGGNWLPPGLFPPESETPEP